MNLQNAYFAVDSDNVNGQTSYSIYKPNVMKIYIFLIIISFLFVISCDKEEITNDYDSTMLLGKIFISTNNANLTIILPNGGGSEIFKDTTWYDFNNSNQLIVKSPLILPNILDNEKKDFIPYQLQNNDTLYYAYVNTISDYVIENENSIKFTSKQVNFPGDYTFLYESDRKTNSMQILEFNDSFLKVQFEYTIISTGKDSTYTQLLKPVND